MSTTEVMLHKRGSYPNGSAGPSLIIPGRNEGSVSSIEDTDLASEDGRTKEDNISFLRLPYHIWKKIFRYLGVICPCHIALLPIRSCGIMTRQRSLPNTRRPDLMTCAFRKVPEFDDDRCDNHEAHLLLLKVSRMARFITLKVLLQEGSFHLELRDITDVDGLKQTLRGFDGMQPLNQELKNLHVKLFFTKAHTRSSYLGVWHYFCDYFGKHLKDSLLRFGLECRLRSVENAEDITSREATSNLNGPLTCNVIFESLSPNPNQETLCRYAQLSKQFVRDVVAFQRTGTFRFMDLPTEIQMLILHYALVIDEVLYRGQRSWVYSLPTQRQDNGQKAPSHSCCMCSMLKHRKPLTTYTACSCLRKRLLAMDGILKPDGAVTMSPVPIFLANKHINALGGSVFYSQNRFKLVIEELFNFCNYQRPYVNLGFPKRHIKRVRHLRITMVIRSRCYYYTGSGQMKEYKRLAELLKEAFERTSIDLIVDKSWEKHLSPEEREKLLSLFDHFEGERPEWYRRK
ncbi:hypothetical protein DPV78_003171 [Talaromyces pinophilus]|nr:hypothetical protein DPV78_003171 [Talaromyces pinophilus]